MRGCWRNSHRLTSNRRTRAISVEGMAILRLLRQTWMREEWKSAVKLKGEHPRRALVVVGCAERWGQKAAHAAE